MRWQSNWFKWISLDIVGYMINYMKHGFLQIHPVAPSCAHLGNWLSTRLHVESTIIDDRTLMPRKTPQSHRKKKQVGKWTQIPSRTQIKFHVVCPPESTCYTTYTYTFAIGLALQTLWESPTFPANHVSHFLRFSPWYIYICIYIDIYIYIEMLLFNLFGAWTCCFYLFYTPGAVRLTFWGPGSTNPDRVVWRIEVL